MVFMTDSSDHITGKASLTLTITASKNGAAFASISPTVNDRGTGWYEVQLTTSHTDTLKDLVLHITSAGADPTDCAFEIVAYDPLVSTNLGMSYLSGSVALDSTVSKAAGAKGTDNIHDDLDTHNTLLGTKIPTNFTFTGANVNAESKVTAAPANMALDSTVSKDATVAKAAGTKGTDNIHDDLDTHNTLLGTKIPTNLSFSGANVNAESKVTAAPANMALDSTVAKESTLTTIYNLLLFVKRFLMNKKLWNDGTKQWDIYDDAGTSILYNWKPHIKAGGDVTMSDSAFASTDKVV
jgi:hypothetical protein